MGEKKKRFGIHSYRVRYTIEIFMLTFAICSIMTMFFYQETAEIVHRHLQGNEDIIMQELEALRSKLYLMTLGFGALSLGIAAIIVQNIRKPLKKIQEYAVALANGDLTSDRRFPLPAC